MGSLSPQTGKKEHRPHPAPLAKQVFTSEAGKCTIAYKFLGITESSLEGGREVCRL